MSRKRVSSGGRRRGPRDQRAAKVAASPTLAAWRSLRTELLTPGKFVPAWARPGGSPKWRAEYEGRRRGALQVLTQPPEGRLAWLVQFVRREPRPEEFAIAGEDHIPVKARILLMLALSKTTDRNEIQRIFSEY